MEKLLNILKKFQVMISFKNFLKEDKKNNDGDSKEERTPYIASYGYGKPRVPRIGHYNPKYMDKKSDYLTDENGKNIEGSHTHILIPKEHMQQHPPIEHSPNTMYRGMSHAEYHNFKKTGEIKSDGSYNFDFQKGLTYFTSDHRAAESYANSFAPEKHKPTWDKHAYIVAVHRVDDKDTKHIDGVASHEIGVTRPVKNHEVTAVYRGKVVAYDPGEKDSEHPHARLHWEKINHD